MTSAKGLYILARRGRATTAVHCDPQGLTGHLLYSLIVDRLSLVFRSAYSFVKKVTGVMMSTRLVDVIIPTMIRAAWGFRDGRPGPR